MSQFGMNANWHFGDSLSLNFQMSPLSLEISSIQAPSNTESASLSDETGNLLLYSDGNQLFNAFGNVVQNGTFSNSATENLLAPVPGQNDRFYLFRSDASFGVDYSIVDFSLSLEGEINQVEKETQIQEFESELLMASHPNNIDYWLIVVNNNGGLGLAMEIQINTYLVSASGITLNEEFSENYAFANFYPSIDDARISPNCDIIATSHKGHNITLFEFDNSMGTVQDFFEQTVVLPDSWGSSQLNYLEFSPSGQFIYVLQDHYFVSRFEVSLSYTDFQSSGELMVFNDSMYWSHIKRGPDDKILLVNQATNTLDFFSDSDELDPLAVEFVLGEIDLPRSADFFPNSISLCLTPQSIVANDLCEGWSAPLTAFGYDFSDSLYWDIDIPDSEDTLFFGTNPTAEDLEVGVYPLEFHYLVDTIWYVLYDTIEVFSQPTVDFGPDQTLCEGQSLTLNAGPPDYNYFWIDGTNEPQIEINAPGLYAVIIGNGPCAASDEIQIDYIYQPSVNLTDSVLCFEEAQLILDAYDPHAISYEWNTGDTLDSLLVAEEGLYTVILSNPCFQVQDSAYIKYVLIPDLVEDSYSVCGDDSILVSSAYTSGEFAWSNGSIAHFFFNFRRRRIHC